MRPVRAVAAFAAVVLSLVLLPFLGSPAQAATCATYPPSAGPAIAVSATVVRAGQPITVTGSNFAAGASVRLDLHSAVVTLATVTVRADGSFSTVVRIPASFTGTGGHELVAVGGQSAACPADPAAITISGSGVDAVSTSRGASGGGLAFTGARIATYLAIAAGLVGAGLLVARSGRRPAASRRRG